MRYPTVFLAGLFAAAILGASAPSNAQQSGLQGAMQAFGNLSPDEQQAILQRLSGQTAAPPATQLGANTAQLQPNESATNALNGNRLGTLPQSTPLGPPVFAGMDFVLLDINLPGERTVAQQTADEYERQVNAAEKIAMGLPSTLPGVTAQADTSATNDNASNSNNANNSNNNSTDTSAINQPAQRVLDAQHDLIKVLAAGNPYQLDRDGNLQLPGFRSIPLAGLTPVEATRRLAAEPALQAFEIRVVRLAVTPSGPEGLKPYGYDLFAIGQQGLSPVTSAPVAADYVVGPGDNLNVQLYGSQNLSLQLVVSRDGIVNFPQIGPIRVGGQRYSAVKREIEARVAKQMIGVRADLTMGDTRTVNVFVLGEAMYPGSYTVTGLATVTTALFAAGGVKPQGSLRRIQVRRQGALVREFDLYDLLMRGDSANDVALLPGDVVMVPSVGPTASIDGEVQRPAIYELKGPATVSDLIAMAGGLTPEADPGSASLVHVNADRQRVVIDVNPGASAQQSQSVGNGDALRVARLKPTVDSGVMLQGYVYRPGNFAWHEGLKLTDVLGSLDELKPNADQHYVLIRRVLMPEHRTAVLSADLAVALRAPTSPANVALQPRDTLTVFDLQTGRDRIIEPLMLELSLQGNLAQPTEIVHVDGMVKVPGDYPLESGMRVSDLIRAGGSLEPSAFGGKAELSRFTVRDGQQRRTDIINVDLAAVARGDATADLPLQPFDQLSVKEISGWTDQDQVTLQGEVRFPGIYAIQRGETLRSVIGRAGGLTDLAFADGAVFVREELREREQDQLDRLAERLKSDVTSMALMAARAGQASATTEFNVGQSLLSQIKATKAVGRLVIDLQSAIDAQPGSADDIALRSGDELVIPRLRQEVMVLGEVQSPASQLFRSETSRDDYISQSGGFTRQADKGRVYVVRANGSVVSDGRHWLIGFGGESIRPGDTVVVPFNTERLPALPLWQSVTQILYNIAISAAALHSFK